MLFGLEGYDTEFIGTAVVGFDLLERIGLYVEGIGMVNTDADTDSRGIVGVGTTYALTDDIQFDVGVNVGLTGDADDVNLFAGMSIRF